MNINTRVVIISAGSDTGRTGVVVTDEGMWNGGTSGDRVVLMDDTQERLVFESWMMKEDGPTVLDTPAAIGFWHWRSRLGQLALEISTGLKAGRKPILRAMYEQGMIDAPLRGTKANKIMVLGLMVEAMQEANPGWEIPGTVARALNA